MFQDRHLSTRGSLQLASGESDLSEISLNQSNLQLEYQQKIDLEIAHLLCCDVFFCGSYFGLAAQMGEEQNLQGMDVEGVTMVVKLELGEEIFLVEADMVAQWYAVGYMGAA